MLEMGVILEGLDLAVQAEGRCELDGLTMQRKSGFDLSDNMLILTSDWLAPSLQINLSPNPTTGPIKREVIACLYLKQFHFLEVFGKNYQILLPSGSNCNSRSFLRKNIRFAL
jgi:hypothetical protein